MKPISAVLKALGSRMVEIGWTVANWTLVALPVIAVFLHVCGDETRAAVTRGMSAAFVSKIAMVFEVAIYTVLSCLIASTLAVLHLFHKRRSFGRLLWAAIALLLCSVLLDNKVGTLGADSLAEIPWTNWREATAYCWQALCTLNISGKQLTVALSPAAFYAVLTLFSKLAGLRPRLAWAMCSLALSAGTRRCSSRETC
jgi:hypothetical protein